MTARVRTASEVRRSRGDRQRDAIVTAVRELLQERSFADLSVSTISERAGVARSGFYFYFDSKYAVLAVILADASEELDEPHPPLRAAGAGRDAGGVRQADGRQCRRRVREQRSGDVGVRSGPEHRCADPGDDGRLRTTASSTRSSPSSSRTPKRGPISDDLPALVRTLAATTTMTLTHDSTFVGRGEDPARAVDIVERLWLNALWGGRPSRLRQRR